MGDWRGWIVDNVAGSPDSLAYAGRAGQHGPGRDRLAEVVVEETPAGVTRRISSNHARSAEECAVHNP